jgi:hypothetical protein
MPSQNAPILKNTITSYEPVGMIQATENTPDIIFPNDRSSEKVAVLIFLTLWFLPKPIQALVKQRVAGIVGALSPMSGGKEIEQFFSNSQKFNSLTARRSECFDYSSDSTKYTGACRYPTWNKKGEAVRLGYLAIYAASIDEDEAKGYTQRARHLNRGALPGLDVAEEDAHYRVLDDTPHSGLCVNTILGAYHSGEISKQEALASMFAEEFSDINSLYDMVPKRTAHEVAHILEHGSGLYPHDFIRKEVTDNVPSKNSMLRHYRKATEAVAELGGIALLQHVQRNAGLCFGIPTTMLDKILPDSYAYIEQQVDLLSRMGMGRDIKAPQCL